MSRPNFFCNMNTLVYLAQMKYSDDHKDIDISVDCIDAPAWLLFSSDEENYYLKLIKRYEFFWYDENKGITADKFTVSKATGDYSGLVNDKKYTAKQKQINVILFIACRNLSFYAQKWFGYQIRRH